uniref:Alpha-2-HS-glycoprotein-like n=1 Tax=Acanthochromis polyacanthus TaxID=80966 RepID=A0A3Q1FAA9_9TELE
MKVSPVFILLFPAVLLCGAAPALEALSCSDNSSFAAARMAVIHINEHHNHGYKFRLSQITGSNVEQIDDGCNLELQLELLETKCHVVNPKHFEDCEIREDTDRIVKANCTVGMTVKNGDAKVSKYECDTQQAKTNKELWLICPDCPTLDPIESPESVNIAHETLTKINANTSHQHLYTLLEVGRMLSSYIPFTGMQYSGELVFVETNCPVGSKILPKACTPLCPDRAHHAFCDSSFSANDGIQSVECNFYPPSNTTALGPGEQEPLCRRHQTHIQGPTSDPGTPQQRSHPCLGFSNNTDQALHPICPWSLPGSHTDPKPSQS